MTFRNTVNISNGGFSSTKIGLVETKWETTADSLCPNSWRSVFASRSTSLSEIMER